MWNPTGNMLPRCPRWADHHWRLLQYVVTVQASGAQQVVELHQCPKCMRVKVDYMTPEIQGRGT